MKTLKKSLVLFLAVAMVFTIVGCGGASTASTQQPTTNNDDFFTDDTNTISRQDETSDGNGASSNNNQSSGAQKQDGDNKSPTVNNQQQNNSIPEENKVGGKSWGEVLSSMPKNLRGTTVKLFNWNPITEYSGASQVIKEFEAATGITVEWETISYDDYFSKIASSVAAGESPDVCRLFQPNSIGLQSFQPISVSGFDFSDDAWDQVLMKNYTINGKAYGMNLKGTHMASAQVMYYNKALINKYDFEDPYKLWKQDKWTWSKFLEMCEEFVDESGEESAAGSQNWHVFMSIFGVPSPISYDGTKYSSNLGNKTFLKVTQEIADLYNTSKLLSYWDADQFDRGERLFWAGHGIFGRRKNSYFASLKKSGSLYSVPMPKVEGQSKYYQSMGEYEAYGIPKGAKNATAVPYLVRYLMDPVNYDMKAYMSNSQVLEVYNWAMSQENAIWGINFDGGMQQQVSDGFEEIEKLPGAQIKSFIDSNASVINKRVSDLNSALNKLK